ncbi:hypothetical protein AA0114_g10781 [Alternaria tenuissima]|uniref:Uncharacterized protein n=1 Tax=Alternaria tenuissima TaxID=119927 RepID=A0A4Q4M380_9PLEO|nr:hypothetical protein AA0114_g10781 [Alternaria tenuissima]
MGDVLSTSTMPATFPAATAYPYCNHCLCAVHQTCTPASCLLPEILPESVLDHILTLFCSSGPPTARPEALWSSASYG